MARAADSYHSERRNAGRGENAKRLKFERIMLGISRKEQDRMRTNPVSRAIYDSMTQTKAMAAAYVMGGIKP